MIVEIKGHKIEVFDSIQDLGILRFQKFNKYQMQSNEVGNTFDDYDARTQKALAFLHKGMTNEAIQELSNRRLTVFNAYNEYSPIGQAFAVMVKRIDDKYYKGITSDEIDEVLEHLEKIGLGHIKSMETLIEVKKKSKLNWKFIFHKIFKTTNSKVKTS